MTIIQTPLGTLAELQPGWWPSNSFGMGLTWYDGTSMDYDALFRAQPAVRTVVTFLARNIASLPLKVFQRVSDTDRRRVTTSDLAKLLARPNPGLTRYGWVFGLVADLAIYDSLLNLKVKLDGKMALVPVPPPWAYVRGGLLPQEFEVQLGSERLRGIQPDQVIYVHGYAPLRRVEGLSALESLQAVLAEEQAAGSYRQGYWRNAARISGVIERPKDAPDWGPEAQQRFRAEFQAAYAGSSGTAGQTAILEEGMTFRPLAFSAVDSQLIEARKLTREEVASAYHVPPPMIGIMDSANYSNVVAFHTQLYQDTLGPWIEQLQQELELQLAPEFPELLDDTYLEFDIQGKLQGSFQEQTTALQSAVGRPWMTAAEARARMNLPDLGGDSNDLVVPLNVLLGGQASPSDSGSQNQAGGPGANPPALPKALRALADSLDRAQGLKAAPGIVDPTLPRLRAQHQKKWSQVLGKYFARQRASVESKLGALKRRNGHAVGTKVAYTSEDLWDQARWDDELGTDLFALSNATATVWGQHTADAFGTTLDSDRLTAWLAEHTRIAASNINAFTLAGLIAALRTDTPEEEIGNVFDVAESSRSEQIARTQVTAVANFGSHSGAEQAGARTKTWVVTSSNPRSAHAAVNGTTIPLGDDFLVGGARGRWPGDPNLGADNNSDCSCSVQFSGE